MLPAEIEKRSFEIIESEAGPHGFSDEQWTVVSRMIHTSADFEYLKTVRIHPGALDAGVNAIRSGKTVVTDTQMARSGIRRRDLDSFGCDLVCLIDATETVETAARSKTTRARAAVDAAVSIMEGGIYVVGNAPTALFRLLELIGEKKVSPALIVGLPVGFVNAAESKEALVESGCPHISNAGRKGGSNVAAAVVNALLIIANRPGRRSTPDPAAIRIGGARIGKNPFFSREEKQP